MSIPETHLLDIVIPVYNGKDALAKLIPDVQAWVSTQNNIHVYIVDDGSKDKLDDLLTDLTLAGQVHLIVHDANKGRSGACNTGFRTGSGKFVAFLDVDCIPDDNWVDRFIESLTQGYDGVFGNIKASGDSFWSDYSNAVYLSRADSYKKNKLVFSTPFCGFRRDALEAVGGFCEEYVRYGFEDRDLICSLIDLDRSNFDFLGDVYIEHQVEDSLSSLERKMEELGSFTAPIYAKRFLSEYKTTQYWWFDSRVHGYIYNKLLSLLKLPRSWISSNADKFLECKFISFPFKKLLVNYLMAMSFYRGSAKTKK